MVKPIEAINDFVVKFANVNGSGSASANTLFAKAILRMGVPVSPRNIFPSNIQGLPTWYEVRVSERGHLGRRGGVDLMVAMNPQTWDKDVAEVEPGGYLFYDSTKPLPKSKFRDDITVIGMPLTAICNDTYTDPRQRQLFKNIIYVGALSALLDIDAGVIAELIGEQYKGKESLLKPNVHALQLGRDYALAKLACPIGLRVQRADAVGRQDLHRGQQRRGARLRLRRRDGCGVVPDHAVLLDGRGVPAPLQAVPPRPAERQGALRDHPGRGRARLDRHGDRRGVERRAGVHLHLRPGHLAHAGVHRPRVLRRDPGGDLRRAARRSFDRYADAHPAVRRARRARTRRTATPSTRCSSRRTRRRRSSSRRSRSTSPTGCRRRYS